MLDHLRRIFVKRLSAYHRGSTLYYGVSNKYFSVLLYGALQQKILSMLAAPLVWSTGDRPKNHHIIGDSVCGFYGI